MTDQANTTVSELLPCPFCGSADVLPAGSMSRTQVWCKSCSAEGPSVFHGGPTSERPILNRCEAEAIAAWNTRATPAPEPQPEVAAEPVAYDLDRLHQRISVFREMKPEEGEDWESWYYAAFDMLGGEITKLQSSPTPPVVEEAVKADAWQDIATAPKDGTFVLLGHSNAAFDGWWDSTELAWVDGSTSGYDDSLTRYDPTRWQPLPAPPALKQQAPE